MTINAKFMALTEDATDEEIRETFAHAVLEGKGYQNPAEAVKKWFAAVEPNILDAVTKCGRTVLHAAANAAMAETSHSILQEEIKKRFDQRPASLAPDMFETWETMKAQCEAELKGIADEVQSIHERYHKALLTSINLTHVLYHMFLATSMEDLGKIEKEIEEIDLSIKEEETHE